jgi:hypothetical protein
MVFVFTAMTNSLARKFATFTLVATTCAFGGIGCMTTYDAYGRPVQSVDPGAAAVGIAAAGVLGYALANDHNHSHHHYHGSYHRPYGCRPHYRY